VHHSYGDFRARREALRLAAAEQDSSRPARDRDLACDRELVCAALQKLMQSRAEIDNLQQQVNEQQTLLAVKRAKSVYLRRM